MLLCPSVLHNISDVSEELMKKIGLDFEKRYGASKTMEQVKLVEDSLRQHHLKLLKAVFHNLSLVHF